MICSKCDSEICDDLIESAKEVKVPEHKIKYAIPLKEDIPLVKVGIRLGVCTPYIYLLFERQYDGSIIIKCECGEFIESYWS